MSANNYYGFTHAGTQYGANFSPSASLPQTAYSVTGQMYQTPAARQSYDQNYNQSQTVANAVPVTYSYNGSSTVTPSYGADSTQYMAQGVTYPYAGGSTYTNSYNSVVTNYAASALYSQGTVQPTDDSALTAVYSSAKTGNWNFRKSLKGNKPKTAPKVQQLHYCEVCKISCAGPQTYKEHLEGQRHKKKEAQMKSGNSQTANKRNHGHGSCGISLRCELCDVTCTGNDAYAAHVRGSKHQKVVKLHTKLGKPIPSVDPVVVAQNSKITPKIQGPQIPSGAGKIKVLGTPRINFIGGGRLHTTQSGELKEENLSDTQMEPMIDSQESVASILDQSQSMDMDKCDAQPVGQDYIEEMKSDDGKAISFHCKLCDCKFNDPNAKEMHLKGRRHRLQYKKKVDPNLIVDVKPSLRQRKPMLDPKDRRHFKKDMHYWNSGFDWYSGRYYDHMPPSHPPPPPPHLMGPPPPPGFSGFMGSPMMPPYRRPNTSSWDDTHIIKKHSEICPKEEELDEIHHVVSCTERALKLASDKIAEDDAAAAMNVIIKRELGDELTAKDATVGAPESQTDKSTAETSNNENGGKTDDAQQFRMLKGLMRVGTLAKGLLLSGDREIDLVVICAEKPTKQLLERVADNLPQQLQSVSASEIFEIVMKPHESSLSVSSTNEPKITVNVSFTSPLVREDTNDNEMEMVKEPKQLLDRQKCLHALAALRHAKWFQAVELLCEKVISSAGDPITPGEALRHTFEAIASGLLLPGGAGLIDPCEKEPTDALAALTRQEREDITSSAQHALRLIAFRQIYKILGVDPLPQRSRKRQRDSENDDSDAKKNKKEENGTEEESEAPAEKTEVNSEQTETVK